MKPTKKATKAFLKTEMIQGFCVYPIGPLNIKGLEKQFSPVLPKEKRRKSPPPITTKGNLRNSPKNTLHTILTKIRT